MRPKKNVELQVDRAYSRLYDELSETEVIAFERLKARKKRKRRRKRHLALSLASIFLILGFYLLLPISRVQTLNIYQNKMIDARTIHDESRIQEGQSIMLLLVPYFIEQNIRENPFINGVSVEKKIDGTVNISITERWVVYKTRKDDQWIAYFSDGTSVPIPEEYDVSASILIPVEKADNFPYAELAKNLAYVPREIVDKISEIKHNPSNLEQRRFMFYMNDRNRVSILMDNIKTMMKYYDKLVEKSNNERFEYVMEYTKKGIIGRKIAD